MKYFRLVAGVGLLIVVLALVMPWLTITFLGQFNITLADIYRFISSGQSTAPSDSPQSSITESMAGVIGILITILAYPISIVLGTASLATRKATPFAGIAGIISGVSWILGVESLKAVMVREASQAGGFGGMMAATISSIVTIGYGTYIAIIGGIVIFIAYFITSESRAPTLSDKQDTNAVQNSE